MSTTRHQLIARYDRHASATNRLLEQLQGIDPVRLRTPPPDGGWTALQTVHHLLAAEQASLHSVQKKLTLGKNYDRTGPKHAWHAVLLNVSLYLPIKFKSPEPVRGDLMPENRSLPELQEQATQVQRDWRAFLEAMPDDWLDRAVYRHPRAGTLSWGGVFAFFRQHRIRHRKQIFRAAGQL